MALRPPGKPQPLHRDRILVRDYIDYYNGDRMKLKKPDTQNPVRLLHFPFYSSS